MICPLIAKCKASIDIDKYRNICANIAEDAFKKCDEYKKFTATTKTPLEWQTLLSPV
jgi:hypothetical protein